MRAYEMKVTLDNIKPIVSRRIVVPTNIDFDTLHEVLQIAMGWSNYHQNEFSVIKGFKGKINKESPIEMFFDKGYKIKYTYDFGDSWDHTIELVKTYESYSKHCPQVLEYIGQCPPEDCGGYPGYENLQAVLANPKDDDYEEMQEWVESQKNGNDSIETANELLNEMFLKS